MTDQNPTDRIHDLVKELGATTKKLNELEEERKLVLQGKKILKSRTLSRLRTAIADTEDRIEMLHDERNVLERQQTAALSLRDSRMAQEHADAIEVAERNVETTLAKAEEALIGAAKVWGRHGLAVIELSALKGTDDLPRPLPLRSLETTLSELGFRSVAHMNHPFSADVPMGVPYVEGMEGGPFVAPVWMIDRRSAELEAVRVAALDMQL